MQNAQTFKAPGLQLAGLFDWEDSNSFHGYRRVTAIGRSEQQTPPVDERQHKKLTY